MQSAARTLQLLLFAVCAAGFVAQIWRELMKYFSDMKTVAVSFEPEPRPRFPTFAFCDSRGFRHLGQFPATEAEYEEDGFNMTGQVILNGTAQTDNDIDRQPEFIEFILPTLYNGFCKVIRLSAAHPARTFAMFTIRSNASLHVFLLLDGTEFQLQAQNFVDLQPVLTVDTESITALAAVKRTKKEHCDPDATAADVNNCIVALVAERIKKNLDCVPYPFYGTFPGLKLPVCQSRENGLKNIGKVDIIKRIRIRPNMQGQNTYLPDSTVDGLDRPQPHRRGLPHSLRIDQVHRGQLPDGLESVLVAGLLPLLPLLRLRHGQSGGGVQTDGPGGDHLLDGRIARTLPRILILRRILGSVQVVLLFDASR